MAIKESDFITTNYNLDLSKALNYSLISVRSTFNRMGQDAYSGAKNIMKGILAEEAFQLYLDEMKVKYDYEYLTKRNLFFDLQIILLTFYKVFKQDKIL